MIQISKEEANYVISKIGDRHDVVICSKRKHGHKQGISGKTYYCPEEYKYTRLIEEYNKQAGRVVIEEYPQGFTQLKNRRK